MEASATKGSAWAAGAAAKAASAVQAAAATRAERGKQVIEISGIGILREPFAASARLGLVVDLVDPAGIERLPEPRTAEILGQAIRRVELPAREAGFGADILASLVLSPPVNDV